MDKTDLTVEWDSSASEGTKLGKTICPQCGAIYVITAIRLPSEQTGSVDCKMCGQELKKWSGRMSYDYTILKESEANRHAQDNES